MDPSLTAAYSDGSLLLLPPRPSFGDDIESRESQDITGLQRKNRDAPAASALPAAAKAARRLAKEDAVMLAAFPPGRQSLPRRKVTASRSQAWRTSKADT